MEREDILKSPEYWTAKTQMELYNCANEFMEKLGINRTELSQHLGVSKGYVSQILNGEYDHRMSKFFELSLSFGYIPKVEFIPINEYIESDKHTSSFRLNFSDTPAISDWRKAMESKSQNVILSCDTAAWELSKEVA